MVLSFRWPTSRMLAKATTGDATEEEWVFAMRAMGDLGPPARDLSSGMR